MLTSIDKRRASICKLTKLHLNNIEFFISHFLSIILFLLLLLYGDIESNPGPKKKGQMYISLCHWNVNSSVPYMMVKIFSTWKDVILLEQIILIN